MRFAFKYIKKEKQFVKFYETKNDYENNKPTRTYDVNTNTILGKSNKKIKTFGEWNRWNNVQGMDVFSRFIINNYIPLTDYAEYEKGLIFLSSFINLDDVIDRINDDSIRLLKKIKDMNIDLTQCGFTQIYLGYSLDHILATFLTDYLANIYSEKLGIVFDNIIKDRMFKLSRNFYIIPDIHMILWLLNDILPIENFITITDSQIIEVYNQAKALSLLDKHRPFVATVKAINNYRNTISYDKYYKPYLNTILFENDKYYIDLPKNFADLTNCSNILHNCVGRGLTYHDSILLGKCLIVFIKDKESNEIKACGQIVHIDNIKKLEQCLGFGNAQLNGDLGHFATLYNKYLYEKSFN